MEMARNPVNEEVALEPDIDGKQSSVPRIPKAYD